MAVWQYLGRGRRAAGNGSASGAWRAAWLGGTLLSTLACSGAGGKADADPFAAAGGGTNVGNPATAAAGTGGTPALAQAGSGGSTAADNLADTPGDLIEDEPEPLPEPVSEFPEAPSCEGGEPDACNGASCCAREQIGTGELMAVSQNVTVNLETTYALDKFEVTVGRFRAFVDAFD